LLAYKEATSGTEESRAARRRVRSTCSSATLYKKLSTGEPVGEWVEKYAYPFRWVYTLLNAADYFRQAAEHDGTAPDPRMTEVMERICAARQANGTWLWTGRQSGGVWFEVDVNKGEPSKWLTFYVTRVLDWWGR